MTPDAQEVAGVAAGPRCGCGKKARYFGRFASGVCEAHADQMIADGHLSEFHEDSRARLLDRLPFRPGDWVADESDSVAKVKDVHRLDGELYLDLTLYARNGQRLGRRSPVCGGPRGYEPMMPVSGYRRIAEPAFPLTVKWVDNGEGGRTARYYAGETLPPANWKRPIRRASLTKLTNDSDLRRALGMIAAGHNDARQVAIDALRAHLQGSKQ